MTRMEPMLRVKDLHAKVGDKEILRGIDLEVGAGEVHAIMGPNGSGKSTFAQVLAGRETFEVTKGEVLYQGKDLLALSPEERAVAGIFMAFQYPVEIPGVGNLYFLRTALNALRKRRGEEELDAMDFLALAKEKMKLVAMERRSATRSSRWRCSIPGSPSSTRPTRAWTSTRSGRSRAASTVCAARTAR